ncbi:hypothetical protein T07_311 [Trichinella nelsoni]|uniref:Uncharacterized protein n=1 Tax=Trichinella nelsoni TaxID=6336 RepID=A0A0V0RFM1_9BILA|nr:hypothetical protein T07_311 [Trichinella nelsoni]
MLRFCHLTDCLFRTLRGVKSSEEQSFLPLNVYYHRYSCAVILNSNGRVKITSCCITQTCWNITPMCKDCADERNGSLEDCL